MTAQRRAAQPQLNILHARDDEIFQVKGRIGRLQYWSHTMLHSIIYGVVITVLGMVLGGFIMAGDALAKFLIALMLIGFVVWAVQVTRWTTGRRCHDVGLSSWWSLLMIVPIVNILFSLYLLLAPGYMSTNQWGRSPGEPDGWVVGMFWITLVLYIALFVLSIVGNALLPGF
ncbi:DUF805 domain-containing protein [Salinibius halmophilus]|uniref:DUF805 domain-containing protein n=1 Tax=Salinibius halmophilus TaxID=1853216 RepID=UPI0013148C56|nr:DUF805 domain-containing protein [Salinibius halmophilus]